MAYKHGIYTQEVATSLTPATETSAGLIVAFGTAPIHLATDSAGANKPVLCYDYKEAVAAFGYSDDFDKYTLCEVMQSAFTLFNVAPIVFVNVLDPEKHYKNNVYVEKGGITSTPATVNAPVILSTLKVTSGDDEDEKELVKGTDYTAAFNDDGALVVTVISNTKISDDKIYLHYKELDPTAVTASDVVGGVDANGISTGLQLVDEVFPRFRLIPGCIIAPKYSANSTVAAAMKAKTQNISGNFQAVALVDIPTGTVGSYTAAASYKNTNNLDDSHLIVCYPKVSLGGVQYHLSTQAACLINSVDIDGGDIPYVSPSNHNLQCDTACLADGTEIFYTQTQANYLNGNGIITALNFVGGWKLWGNRTSTYPGSTDPKDSFIPIRRMFNWISNTLVTTFWSKIDNPLNRNLIESVIDSANIWFNGLQSRGAILGGRVELLSTDNTTTELMDGIIRFHVFVTPASPAREITFIQEYDPSYISELFG